MKDSFSSNSTISSDDSIQKDDISYCPNHYFSVKKNRDSFKVKKPSADPEDEGTFDEKKILSPILLASWDRTNTSDRNPAENLQSTLVGCGKNLRRFPVSYSTIRKKRKEFREKMAREIKSSFKAPKKIVVHFDGKLLSDLSGKFGDRLAIVVSGNTPQCLQGWMISANLIEDGTGQSQSNEVIASLIDWNILESMVAICFDTCSANTGEFLKFRTKMSYLHSS